MATNTGLLTLSRQEARRVQCYDAALTIMREQRRVPKKGQLSQAIGGNYSNSSYWVGNVSEIFDDIRRDLVAQLRHEATSYMQRQSAEYTLEFLAKRLQKPDMVPLQLLADHYAVKGEKRVKVRLSIYRLVVSTVKYYVYDGLLDRHVDPDAIASLFVTEFVGLRQEDRFRSKDLKYFRKMIEQPCLPAAS